MRLGFALRHKAKQGATSSERGLAAASSSTPASGGGVSQKRVEEMWRELQGQHVDIAQWTFTFDSAKKRSGVCKYKKRQISVSTLYLQDPATTEQCVRNTLLHEIAHAVVGKEHHHDAVWKAKAISIGCDGCRCGTWEPSMPTPFELRCKSGCWSKGKYRRGTLSDKRRCGRCGAGLEYWHNGKPCKARAPSNKYELRCKNGCWARSRQRRQKHVSDKRRCKMCGGGLEFRRVTKKQP